MIHTKLTNIDVSKRGSIRSLPEKLNIGVGSVHREVKNGSIKRVNNYIKHTLNEKKKESRMNFIFNCINLPNPQFCFFNNFIHIDENWFYLNKVNQEMYLVPEENVTTRKMESKKT